jgi:hypothetical protein
MRHGDADADGAGPPPPPPAGAALFSVPPASPPASGVYAAPAEAFLMRNLDSGQSFLLDQRYWIKDVDTGRVFVLHPEEEGGGAGSAGGSGAGGSGAGGAAGGSPGGGGGADSAARAASGGGAGASGRPASGASAASGGAGGGAGALRVSDLLSGEALSLREFEAALGYAGGGAEAGGGGGGGGGGGDAPSLAAAAGAAARRGAAAGARAAARSGAWLRAAAGEAAARAVGREGRPPAPPDGGAPASPGSASGASSGAHAHAPPPADGLGLPVRVVTSKKAFKEFTDLRLVQTLPAHRGVIWAARFSRGGRHLATAGQDGVVRVWAVARSRGLNAGGGLDDGAGASASASDAAGASASDEAGVGGGAVHAAPLLSRRPARAYAGHRADVLALAWSRTDFLLSASMDKTVRLWHATMPDCLRVFKCVLGWGWGGFEGWIWRVV